MRRRPSLISRAFVLPAALAVTLAACAGQSVDKAGGTRTEEPVVLTLANHEQGPQDVQFWIDEVQRRSGGSLRIQVTNRWRDQDLAYDKATIGDVQAGRVQLAKVAARAYDTVGVRSFQALVAPFLIDNRALEQRVLESDLIGEMLAGTGKLGVVGLAVLPTELRRPLGISRPLVTVEDYRGARISVREGEIAKATFAALGATPVVTVAGRPLAGLDGAEPGFGTIKGDERQAKAVTSNVVFWPMPVTLVVNRTAFDSLTPSQQDALRQAGAAVLSRQFDFLREFDAEDAGILCRRGLRFARASGQDLAALRRAVQAVYDSIEGDPETRSFLQRIVAMKQETGAASTPETASCSPSASTAGATGQQARALDGVYRTRFSKQELVESPLLEGAGEVNDGNWGELTFSFDRGRVTYTQRNNLESYSTSGTYTVNGTAITLSFTEGGNAGETFAGRWSLYRGVLTFERDQALGVLPTPYLVKPWRRVG